MNEFLMIVNWVMCLQVRSCARCPCSIQLAYGAATVVLGMIERPLKGNIANCESLGSLETVKFVSKAILSDCLDVMITGEAFFDRVAGLIHGIATKAYGHV